MVIQAEEAIPADERTRSDSSPAPMMVPDGSCWTLKRSFRETNHDIKLTSYAGIMAPALRLGDRQGLRLPIYVHLAKLLKMYNTCRR